MSKKHTLEYVKQYFQNNDCELLENIYENNSTKMRYLCNCGNTSEISFNSFKRGSRCSTCGKEKMVEKQRLTHDYVKDMFKASGCELLEKEYKNCMVLMRYRCSCGNISKITFNQYRKGQRCAKCGGTEKLILEYVEGFFKERGCELLEKKYKNSRTKMRYKCSCGNISEVNFSSFQGGCRCKECGGNEKFTLEFVYNCFKEQGCELLEEDYINNNTKMKYKCSCGNTSKISFDNFKRGSRCKKCGYEKSSEKTRHLLEFVYNYFKKHDCKLLEKEYKNSRTKMKYKCSCGNISKITFNDFKRGVRCRKCGIEKVSGKNSSSWNPDLTDEDRKRKRNYPEYKVWVKKIFTGDDYTCQKCNKRGSITLNAHHIENYAENKELRIEVNNGVTFCKDCHKKFHLIYGYKKNNKEQIKEFIGEIKWVIAQKMT